VLCFPAADVGDVDVAGLTVASPVDGCVAFDPACVDVELVDDRGNVTRFPNWGDASDLIDVLDVRPDGDGRYEGVARGWSARRPVVEGSQMLGQAIVACARHAPGRRVVSAHMVFLRVADAARPLCFEHDETSGGRTFTTVLVRVLQDRRLCATGTFLLDVTAPDVVRHEAALPPSAAGGPDAAVPFDMSVTGRELRFVGAAYTGDPGAPVGPPVIDAWVRFRSVPDDAAIHAALLAQFTGHVPIAAALRPHAGVGQDQAHRTLSTAINAIAIGFHADVRADQWMLYHHESTFAGDGMTHAACRVHAEDGRLLASFSVDAMVRAFASDAGPVDERTSL
jgi:acyl-CoA thioesterase